MPSVCSVPHCKGNYATGTRVSIHRFPSDDLLKSAWLVAIKRKNFTPNLHSRVCEQHFKDSDYITTASGVHDKTGELIVVQLKNKRLRPDAVPSIFPPYPESAKKSSRSKKASTEDNSTTQDVGHKDDNIGSGTESPDATEQCMIKQELLESTNEPSDVAMDNIFTVEELLPSDNSSSVFEGLSLPNSLLPCSSLPSSNNLKSSSNLKSSTSLPSSSNLKSSTSLPSSSYLKSSTSLPSSSNLKSSASLPSSISFTSSSTIAGEVLPTYNPNCINVKRQPITNFPGRKRKINVAESNDSTCTPSDIQAKVSPVTKQPRKKYSEADSPSYSKKSTDKSSLPTMDTLNATTEIFQTLCSGSENHQLPRSKTQEAPGDLFDVLGNFIADKLRKMNWGNCAFALRSILDIVFKAGQAQQSSEEDSDVYSSDEELD